MKNFRLWIAALIVMVLGMFLSGLAMADVAPPVSLDQFLSQVLDFVHSFGGISWTLKIAGICALLISSMKVSFLSPLWSKLGYAQTLAAPALGLLAGVIALAPAGMPSMAAIAAYIFAGSGAIVLHELLDAAKGIPGIGPMWVAVINFISGILGGSKA